MTLASEMEPSLAESVSRTIAPAVAVGLVKFTIFENGPITPLELPMTISSLRGASAPSWRICTLTVASKAVLWPESIAGEFMGPPGMNVGDFRDPLLADARAGGRVRSARA